MASTPVVLVDDADPAIDYETPDLWKHFSHEDSVHGGTYSAGFTNATAKLSFNGTSVEVYVAVIPPTGSLANVLQPPAAILTLDGDVTLPLIAGSNPSEPMYGFLLFQQANLSASTHTLEIDVAHGDEENNWPFILDYIQYAPVDALSAGLGESSPSSADDDSSSLVGPILGGVVGGLVVLSLLAFAVYRWIVKRRQNKETKLDRHVSAVYLFAQDLKRSPSSVSDAGTATSVYHSDSGIRFGATAEGQCAPLPKVVEDVPPEYTEA
ncbi:hypothetical protein C8Q70DRAFT_174628 [Cubamyces menziesii]|uniref:Uncharacterized protein n=1 Tax=Trametes cubensis TaxID=1111947 RepID=A0AAD7TWV5_9APHY|nr:hypothetical protein C8Q70DRAFT_174628 [Cubamyces menziesii]KAJ8487545.1 hypothetical protein ONZ51_g4125 [Trametes cubensis]